MNDDAVAGPDRAGIAAVGDHLVVVVAHPDDETFGCGSLIARAVRDGATVSVVCATRGEQGERRPDPATDGLPLGAVREAELREAARVLGVDHVELLGHADSGFDGPTPPRALVDVPLDELAAELGERLDDLWPTVVLTLDGSDGHRDHVHLRDALRRAAETRPVRLVHASLARSLMRAWAEEMARLDPDRAYLALDVDRLGRPDEELEAVDTSAVLAVREQAIACHRSQASPFEGLSSELRHRFLTTDHVIEVPLRAPAGGPRPG